MKYVDGYVIPIKKKNVKAYVKMARDGYRLWKKYGALDYKECVGEDFKAPCGMSFSKLAKAKPGETVIFAFVVFKSRSHRDQVNAKVMKAYENMKLPPTMPFDPKRMAFSGFNVLVGD